MTEFEETKSPGAEKRRSTRIIKSVPITVTGTDALGQEFREATTTVMINCFGCKYQTIHYAPKNTIITVEVHRANRQLPARSVRGRVIWVQRPRNFQEVYHIGLEFEVPGNIWSLPSPPSDWFPFPGAEEEPPEPPPVKFAASSKPHAAAQQHTRDESADAAETESIAIAVKEEFEVDCTVEMAAVAAKPAAPHHSNGSHRRDFQAGSVRDMVREIVEQQLAEHTAGMRRHMDDAFQKLLEQIAERAIVTADETRAEVKALREALSTVSVDAPREPARLPRHSSKRRRKIGPADSTN